MWVWGTETTLIYYKGETLKIGDIVVVKYTEKDWGTHSDFITVVCNNDFINYRGHKEKYRKDIPTDSFVMGIADVSITKEGLAFENEEGELESGWSITKLKGYEDCVEGEHWKGYGINYRDISDLDILPEIDIGKTKTGF